jgi:CheY-like chemotaxis protein
MDVMMPVMDGLEATKAIRELEREDAKKIPIIAMTANAFEEDRKACLEAGMNEHIGKPIDIPQLKRAITKLLTKRGSKRKNIIIH